MSLIKCPECGKMISDKAKRCNGCGMERGVMWNNPSSSKDFLEEKPIVEIVEQSQNAKTDNITEKNISKNLNIKVLIVGLTGIIVWSIVLIYIVNSSFDKKIEKILGLVESSNTITEQGEVVDEINNAEMMVDDEEEKREESLENESTEETQQEESYNPQEIRDGKVVFGTSTKEIEVIINEVDQLGSLTNFYFLVTNKSLDTISLKIGEFLYLNDTSFNISSTTIEDEIPAGKSATLKVRVWDLDVLLQKNIESIELKMCIENQEDNELVFYANGLNIPLE